MILYRSKINAGYLCVSDDGTSVGEDSFIVVHNLLEEDLKAIIELFKEVKHSSIDATTFCAFVDAWASVYQKEEVFCLPEKLFNILCND